MIVYVKLFANLAKSVSGPLLDHHPQPIRAGARLEVDLPAGSSLSELVDYLGLPSELVKHTFVNGRAKELNHRLEPGDEVGIFPPIGGG
ncbi:MAG: MoaD/ThiS family protein [Thermoflexales bacterium]|nr:MoaD/ThiS family protein [Thermoflexales bacterium]